METQQQLQLLVVKLKQLVEDRELDVNDLQERIEFLERREMELVRRLEMTEEENQKLKKRVQELELVKERKELEVGPMKAMTLPIRTGGHQPFTTVNWGPEQSTNVKMVRGATAYCNKTCNIYFSSSRSPYILCYNTHSDFWSQVQQACPCLFFGLAMIHNHITAVGGQRGPEITADITTLVEENGALSWQTLFPAMPTRRFNVTAVSSGNGLATQDKLIAVGGRNESGQLNCVEVMDINTQEWSSLAPLPSPADMLSSAISNDQLYFLGGTDNQAVYTCSINKLLCSKPSQREVWSFLEATPTYSPTGIVFQDYLIIVGGYDKDGQDSTALAYYHRNSGTWRTFTNMTSARNKPLLASLSGDRLIVVGGSTKVTDMMNIVQTAHIMEFDV